jgi:hypothetical protein
MIGPTRTGWRARLLPPASAAALALIALATMSPPAHAFWIGFGAPFPGYYYGPGPFYGYAPPYYYAPPAYYPPPGAYPPVAPAPSAYAPAAPTPGAAPSATTMPTASASPTITYTNKPAFTNSAGQTCREYRTTNASAGRDVFGTACREADGQWRVVN